MIKINLLRVDRKTARRASRLRFEHKRTTACGLILLAAVVAVGWRFWRLDKESRDLDADMLNAQNETSRLGSLIAKVQQFEQRSAQLQQRVSLIEQLQRDRMGPVHLLDQISRALPPMVWLTALKQVNSDEILIDGRCTMLTSLADFVANLEQSGYFRKPVEIVTSQTEALPLERGEVISFGIRVFFRLPSNPATGPQSAGKPGG